MSDSAALQVLLFARYAELLGTSRLELALPEPATVSALVRVVRGLPGGDQLPEHPLVAVNARQAGAGDPLRAGDEVALLPPMAGG